MLVPIPTERSCGSRIESTHTSKLRLYYPPVLQPDLTRWHVGPSQSSLRLHPLRVHPRLPAVQLLLPPEAWPLHHKPHRHLSLGSVSNTYCPYARSSSTRRQPQEFSFGVTKLSAGADSSCIQSMPHQLRRDQFWLINPIFAW